MKLLTKYYRANILATLVVVVLSSVCYYLLIHHVLLEQLNDALEVEEQEVIEYVKQNNVLPAPSSLEDQEVNFKAASGKPMDRAFSTILFYNKEDKAHLATRQLVFPIEVNEKIYNVFVLRSQEETDELVRLILIITVLIILLLLIILFLINRFMLQRLWEPFNSTLRHLKQFNLSGKYELQAQKTSINEFRELHDAVSIMTIKVNKEYDALKNLTENASHEMQTPLAIINSKLDLLIQGENINEQQMEQLQAIYNALDRLSRLNKSLLLLAKIENNQFNLSSDISLDTLLKQKLQQQEELTGNRSQVIYADIHPVNIKGNEQLLDILVSNLLNNAIRYNLEGGTISVRLKDNLLVISNTSPLPALDEDKIFLRFYRHAGTKPEGSGLGLSIVKQICHDAGYKLRYFYREGRHYFEVEF